MVYGDKGEPIGWTSGSPLRPVSLPLSIFDLLPSLSSPFPFIDCLLTLCSEYGKRGNSIRKHLSTSHHHLLSYELLFPPFTPSPKTASPRTNPDGYCSYASASFLYMFYIIYIIIYYLLFIIYYLLFIIYYLLFIIYLITNITSSYVDTTLVDTVSASLLAGGYGHFASLHHPKYWRWK